MRRIFIATLAVSGAMAFACGGTEGEEPERSVADTFDAVVPRLLAEYGAPGVAIAVIEDGAVAWSAGYGYADVENDVPVTSETVFQVASLSKAVTALGVMRLVDEGALDLDAPVETYLTRWHLPDSEYDTDGVTLRRILSHTAGLTLHGYAGFEPDAALPSIEQSLSGVPNEAAGVYVTLEPGSQYMYSGGGYTIAQLIIEEATGESFASYMLANVLEPLGMASSTFTPGDVDDASLAKAYDADGNELPNYLFTAKAAAGLYATASGYARFVAALVAGENAVASASAVATMTAPAGVTSGTYGLGVALRSDASLLSHAGANRGWRAYFEASSTTGDGIVVLTNSDAADPLQGSPTLINDIVCVWRDVTSVAEPMGCSGPLLTPGAPS